MSDLTRTRLNNRDYMRFPFVSAHRARKSAAAISMCASRSEQILFTNPGERWYRRTLASAPACSGVRTQQFAALGVGEEAPAGDAGGGPEGRSVAESLAVEVTGENEKADDSDQLPDGSTAALRKLQFVLNGDSDG